MLLFSRTSPALLFGVPASNEFFASSHTISLTRPSYSIYIAVFSLLQHCFSIHTSMLCGSWLPRLRVSSTSVTRNVRWPCTQAWYQSTGTGPLPGSGHECGRATYITRPRLAVECIVGAHTHHSYPRAPSIAGACGGLPGFDIGGLAHQRLQ